MMAKIRRNLHGEVINCCFGMYRDEITVVSRISGKVQTRKLWIENDSNAYPQNRNETK